MMYETLVAAASAFGLGVLTTLNPCPLAINTSALAYLCGMSGGKGQTRRVMLGFVAGLTSVYALLALLAGWISRTVLAHRAEELGAWLLGPALMLAGGVILGLFDRSTRSGDGGKGTRAPRWKSFGTARFCGSFATGAILALAFCPPTAAIFFGPLLLQAARSEVWLLVPVAYALGTALPILVTAGLLLGGVNLTRTLQPASPWPRRLRLVCGGALVLAGAVFSLRFLVSW